MAEPTKETSAARPAAKPDRTAARPKESYSLYDAASGRKLKSGVPRAEAVAEKDRRKHEESKNSVLQPD